MEELVEIAHHHWDNTEQKESKMHEMLMLAQVSHYTGGETKEGIEAEESSDKGGGATNGSQ